MSRTDIAVTGLGLLTPGGVGAAASWRSVCAGVSAAATDPELASGPVDFSCRVPGFDAAATLGPQVWRMDRFVQLAMAAAREAVSDAGLHPRTWDGARVGVVIGVGTESKYAMTDATRRMYDGKPLTVSPLTVPRSTTNMAAGEVAIDLGIMGPSLAVSTACASGATALGVARDLLLAERCDIVLAGGSEASCHPLTALCFSQMQALSRRVHDPAHASRPFDRDRDGFVLGEGAGILVLERGADAYARGAAVRGYFQGYGSATDAYHYAASHPQGEGISRAFHAALADAGMEPADIDHVNAHGTSTPMNDRIEAQALDRLFANDPPPVTSTKGVTGHTLGAAGAIEAAFSLLALRDQLIPPTANFGVPDAGIALDVASGSSRRQTLRAVASNSFGFGGHNSVLIFQHA
ncbi:beta-ketoacyl-[acyl-carrier-protein] synthase family protein [Streptomyces sp. NPDC005865]|uniref:beta-ketoacyl-[acyl-carrier-protein] synthase family protein n=1 Tax=Streptomyces sp. NPDC005865 TaxID=3155453 RepID=UPI0033EC1A8D